MGSSASVMKSSKLSKPDDCSQENWKQILQLFDRLDSDGTHSIEVEELMGHIAVLHVSNNIKQLNDKKMKFTNNTEFEKKRIQADLERNIERSVKSKTGLKVKSLGSVFSKIFDQNKDVLLIYYLCEAVGGKEKPGNGFKDLKWVYPHELIKRFANRFDKRLQEYILGLK